MNNFPPSMSQPQTTGRYLVLLEEDAMDAGMSAISHSTGVKEIAQSRDFADQAVTPQALAGTDAIVFNELGVAVITLHGDQVQSLNREAATSPAIVAIEPERVVYAISESSYGRGIRLFPTFQSAPSATNSVNLSMDYLKGYRDAINQLVDHLLEANTQTDVVVDGALPPAVLDPAFTWGLQYTGVNSSPYSGLGIRVAVLDTGFDLTHPDFEGRGVVSKSFIEGQEVQDGNGHGTHCIGTACGPQSPTTQPRYGAAYNAQIYAGKVLSDEGSGEDGGILAGIDWAIANGCRIISMSLGAPVQPGQTYSKVYERVGRRALRRNTLIIAAAGNDSWRANNLIVPVSHPANCPSIMAVAALDSKLQVATFSNGGLNPRGGQIDIAAPGVDVYSAWPMPTRYNVISGTSMATPHVAGIAALMAEATEASGRDLWAELMLAAKRLPLSSRDVGSGLVQAPE